MCESTHERLTHVWIAVLFFENYLMFFWQKNMSCSVGPLHFKCVSLYPLENHSDLVETEKQKQSVGINRT